MKFDNYLTWQRKEHTLSLALIVCSERECQTYDLKLKSLVKFPTATFKQIARVQLKNFFDIPQ